MRNKKRTKEESHEAIKAIENEESLKKDFRVYNPDSELYVYETNRSHIDQGHQLADRVLIRTGTISNIQEWLGQNKQPIKMGNIEKLAEIINRPFSPLGPGESILVGEYKNRFKELREEGYIISTDYWKMGKKEAIDYFGYLQRVINSQAIL